jgi:hypothetical protein
MMNFDTLGRGLMRPRPRFFPGFYLFSLRARWRSLDIPPPRLILAIFGTFSPSPEEGLGSGGRGLLALGIHLGEEDLLLFYLLHSSNGYIDFVDWDDLVRIYTIYLTRGPKEL